jgi:putative Mg2+ transporter-C (MgtC) family protein
VSGTIDTRRAPRQQPAVITALDLCLRLSSAVFVGGLIGVNREMHAKAVGVRTLGLVGLGSALVTLAGSGFVGDMDGNASRALQGLITGIGFLGGGVIVKADGESRVHGLTTAAAVWVTAALGVACGLGAYLPLLISVILMALLLGLGGRIDHAVHHWWKRRHEEAQQEDADGH